MRKWIGLPLLTAVIAAAQQSPTFRVGTELVQVSVIAQDKQGKPVADLRREEFQILDNGSPQEIRLFLAETEKSNSAAPEPKAPNTFTNQVAASSGSHSGYSVILIDNLFTDFGDPDKDQGSGNARVHALETLRSIPMGERIAIYAVGRKLQVICEFTPDRDLLERQLRMWTPQIDTPGKSGGILETNEANAPEAVRSEAARIDALQRVSSNNDEMDLVADHLAGIPGRKNLIWLSVRFIIGPGALRKFNDASVSIYPVDLDGVCYPPVVSCTWPRPTALMDSIAAQTGGVAYYSRNDIAVAMREAMDDGRVSYTLGFYPSGDSRSPQVHQLAVRVSRPGVTLRYRTSYQSEAPQPVSTNPKADLTRALNRPIDATALPIKASVTRNRDRLNLEAALDVASLGLALKQNLWTGKIEVVARFTAADGSLAGEVFYRTLTLNLRQATYDQAVRGRFLYHNELSIPAKAVELKLLIANLASGKLGTLTIPLSEIAISPAAGK